MSEKYERKERIGGDIDDKYGEKEGFKMGVGRCYHLLFLNEH